MASGLLGVVLSVNGQSSAGFRQAGWMVVYQDHRRRVAGQCRFDHFTRVDGSGIQRALEQLLELDDAVLAIQKQDGEYLPLIALQQGLQATVGEARRGERLALGHRARASRLAIPEFPRRWRAR